MLNLALAEKSSRDHFSATMKQQKLTPLARRIQSRLDALGKTARGASMEAGLGASTIRNVFEGKSESPRGNTLTALARVLETTEAWLLHGRPESTDIAPSKPSVIRSFDPDEHEIAPRRENMSQPRRVSPGAVPEFDLRAGASYGGGYALPEHVTEGDGRTYEKDAVKAEWFFPEVWLKGEMRLSMAQTDIVAIDGPSMLPDLAPGDRVLIDRSNRDPKQDAIFAIRDGDSIIVKHVQLIRNTDPPRIVCRSSNPKYEPFELILDGEQADIIGRVAGRISRL